MTRQLTLALLTLAAALTTPWQGAHGEGPSLLAQLGPLGELDSDPDPMPELAVDPGPAPREQEQQDPEELSAPASNAASDMDETEASRLVGYNSVQNPWLPICDEDLPGWLPELPVPQSCLDCRCDGKTPGRCCTLWRSFQKPTHPSIDQDCVVCVKEPCLGYEKVHTTVDAVVQKCFESEEEYCDKECSDGRCIEKKGTKIVRQLHPCNATVKLFYWKPVVKYRDVYYYINCEPCNADDRAIAQR